MTLKSCTCCNEEKSDDQFWTLNRYYGISGRFCSECYDKVSHDAYGNPKHPDEYCKILLRFAKD